MFKINEKTFCWVLILDDRLKIFNRWPHFLPNKKKSLTCCVTPGHRIPLKSRFWDIRFQQRISDGWDILMVSEFIPGILVDGSIGWWPENGNPSTFGSPIWSWMSGWSEWNPWEFRRTDPLEFSKVGKNKLLELRESICMVNSPCSIYLKFEVNFLCIELNVDITNPNYHKYWQQTVYNPIAYRTYSLVEDLKN